MQRRMSVVAISVAVIAVVVVGVPPVVWFRQPVEAPASGRFVEPLPRPFHDHHRAPRHERGRDQIKHLGQIRHVMHRRACHHRVEPGGQIAALELDLTVRQPRRRLRVHSGRLVPG